MLKSHLLWKVVLEQLSFWKCQNVIIETLSLRCFQNYNLSKSIQFKTFGAGWTPTSIFMKEENNTQPAVLSEALRCFPY